MRNAEGKLMTRMEGACVDSWLQVKGEGSRFLMPYAIVS